MGLGLQVFDTFDNTFLVFEVWQKKIVGVYWIVLNCDKVQFDYND